MHRLGIAPIQFRKGLETRFNLANTDRCLKPSFKFLITVEPLTNDHPHQRPSLSYDHISCDGQGFLFVYESLTSDHPSYTTTPMWFWGWSYKRGSTGMPLIVILLYLDGFNCQFFPNGVLLHYHPDNISPNSIELFIKVWCIYINVVVFILLVQDSHFCWLFLGDTPSSETNMSVLLRRLVHTCS